MRLKSYGYYIDGVLFICFLTYVFIIYAYDRDGTWAYQKTQSSSTKSDQQIFYENYRNNGRREDILTNNELKSKINYFSLIQNLINKSFMKIIEIMEEERIFY